ncbi:MAG: alanine--tRNA ligase, partial [Clostridiales bacterium]|nr:alanine--tRNA ligase [Clostridiales bacterium]
SNDALRKMGDTIKDKYPNAIAVIAGTSNNKTTLLAISGKSAVKMGAHAGKIVSQVAAITGSKGGGRPDSAMAGVGDINKLPEALNALESIVEGI